MEEKEEEVEAEVKAEAEAGAEAAVKRRDHLLISRERRVLGVTIPSRY